MATTCVFLHTVKQDLERHLRCKGIIIIVTITRLDTFEKRGVIPRAVEHIFQETKNLADLGWTFKMRVGFQEIYNETIRDLLSNQKTGK